MKIIFFGSSDFGLPSLEQLLADSGITVVGVVSQPDRPAGRQQQVWPTPISAFAQQRQLPLWRWSTLRAPEVVAELSAQRADFFVVAAYGLLLPAEILALVPQRAINIHGSLLPKYRGATPVPAAILNGDAETGVSFMVMTPGLDDGPILAQWSLPISPTDTTPRLLQKLSTLAAGHLVHTLQAYAAGQIKPQPQPTTGMSLTKKLNRLDGLARWDAAATEERKIRAYEPWPGLWTHWGVKRLRILGGQAERQSNSAAPGTVIRHQAGWAIACRDGILVPTNIHLASKSPQPALAAADWPGFIGSVLS